jgi:hypothetical protein
MMEFVSRYTANSNSMVAGGILQPLLKGYRR